MSRTGNETLGRRRFQLGKAQAVEDAIEKIRRGPAADWPALSNADYRELREVLGELWVCVGRERWEQFTFSTLTHQEIHDLLMLGAGKEGRIFSCTAVEMMDAILSHIKSPPQEP